jgi:hypothetical protein
MFILFIYVALRLSTKMKEEIFQEDVNADLYFRTINKK